MKDGEKVMMHVRPRHITVVGALIVVLVAAVAIGIPDVVSATHICATLDPASTADSDADGLSDVQECTAGLTLRSGIVIPSCVVAPSNRSACLDPDTKDFFIAVIPATTGSLLPAGGFDLATGFAALGITAHQVDPAQLGADRTVSATSSIKAIRVTESLDTNGDILGICNQGTPQDLDGCVVYTQRILNFINTTCDSAGDKVTNRQAVFQQYLLHTIVHEAGHTLGGLAPQYNANYGGNHYKTGAGYFMDQSVQYSTKGGKCTFSVYQNWNLTLDPPGVKLKTQ